LTVAGGCALAFIPINERPLDVWIRNFILKLYEPSQYYFHKKNTAPDFLKDLYFTSPQIITAHVDARQKLTTYVQGTQGQVIDPRKNDIHDLISDKAPVAPQTVEKTSEKTPVEKVEIPTPSSTVTPVEPVISNPDIKTVEVSAPVVTPTEPAPIVQEKIVTKQVPTQTSVDKTKPFFWGTLHTAKNIPIPNTLVYLKDTNNKVVRILKTNIHGVFATFHSLTPGEYVLEGKDTSQKYFFDTMKIQINQDNPEPISVHSKELI
jgi:hypothetical protein